MVRKDFSLAAKHLRLSSAVEAISAEAEHS